MWQGVWVVWDVYTNDAWCSFLNPEEVKYGLSHMILRIHLKQHLRAAPRCARLGLLDQERASPGLLFDFNCVHISALSSSSLDVIAIFLNAARSYSRLEKSHNMF